MQDGSSALRADARRNRERIVSTAAQAFATEGPISLELIAKRAGVGSATLYRHFPTREELVEEVYRDQMRPLRDEAERLQGGPDPARALRDWMVHFAEWAAERHGVFETLVAMSVTGRFGSGPVCDEVLRILAMLLESGADAGVLRRDVDALDVSALLAGTLSVAGAPAKRDQLDRLLDLVVDGLRVRPVAAGASRG